MPKKHVGLRDVFGIGRDEMKKRLGVSDSFLDRVEQKIRQNSDFWSHVRIEKMNRPPEMANEIEALRDRNFRKPEWFVAKHDKHGEVGLALVEDGEIGSYIHTKEDHRRRGIGMVLAIKQILDREKLVGELTEDGEKLWRQLKGLGINNVEIVTPSYLSSKKYLVYHRDPKKLKDEIRKLVEAVNLFD